MSDTFDPSVPSGDVEKMLPYYQRVAAIMGGVETMREAGRAVLPAFPGEMSEDYQFRSQNSKLTNVFSDIVENLAQRPFATKVVLGDDDPQVFHDFAEDVDGKGSSLHTFAGERFFDGIAYAADFILVDYPKGIEGATKEDERKAGLRPRWVPYCAEDVLCAESAIIAGKEQFTCVRLREWSTRSEDGEERCYERVRILKREGSLEAGFAAAQFELWEYDDAVAENEAEWRMIDAGPISIGVIPFVPFLTGRRRGKSWVLRPPMQAAAELQVDLYQQETGLKYAKIMTAFPMLAGNNVQAPRDAAGEHTSIRVGPHVVLISPPTGQGSGGSWGFIEPAATSLTFLAGDIKETITQLRELGRQPLTAQSGNLTVITTAVAAQKGNAAIQAWAMNLKDTLENCFYYTGLWMNQKDVSVTVMIDLDFDLTWSDTDTFGHVLSLRSTGEISRDATLHEAKRRRVLDPDFDPDEDAEKMLAEMEGEEDDEVPEETGLPNGQEGPPNSQEGENTDETQDD